MATTILTNFGAGSQGTAVPKNLKPWNYATTFRVISDNGSVARMTDILSPLDLPTTLKVTSDSIANVYSTIGGGIVPLAQQSLNVTGKTTMCELTTFLTKSDGITTKIIPVQARIITRTLNDADLTPALVEECVMAAFAGLADSTGVNTVLSEKMRGALTPAGI